MSLKRIHIAYLGVVLFLTSSVSVFAQETLNYNIHHDYVTPRALGMGDTFSGIDDYNVLFYNPAGLANLDQKDFNIAMGGGTSPDAIKFEKDIKDVSGNGTSNPTDVQNISNLLQSKYGKMYAARLPEMSFIYTRPNWGFALIPVDLSLALMPHQLAGPALDVTAYQDTTLAFGWAHRTNNKKFSWGFLAKAVYRGNVDKSFLGVDLANNKNIIQGQDYKEGMTVDADIGTQFRPFLNKDRGFFKWLNPTFALVLRNAADEGFFSNYKLYNKNSDDTPEKLHRRVDVGSTWDGPGTIFKPRLILDVRDIGVEQWSFRKGLHTGLEFKYDFGRGLKGSIQGGTSEGYLTTGIGIQTLFIKIELVTYAEEYGTSDSHLTDRQYMARLNFNF